MDKMLKNWLLPGFGWVMAFAIAYIYIIKPVAMLLSLFGCADIQQITDIN